MKAAWSKGIFPASKTTFSGATTYWAMAPGTRYADRLPVLAEVLPVGQTGGAVVAGDIRLHGHPVAGANRVTFSPTASTTPENSWPGVIG